MRRVLLVAVALVSAAACNGSDGAGLSPTTGADTIATTTTSPPATTPTTTATTSTTAVSQYVFPISPARGVSYGRTHAGYKATDVFAPCGAAYVAATDGRLDDVNRVDRWDPGTDDPALRGGLWVSFVARDGVRYYGSHLASITPGLETGSSVTAGQELGRVGRTGNAAKTPCHVHFGLSPASKAGTWDVRRGLVYPWPYLDSWRTGGQLSPREEALNLG